MLLWFLLQDCGRIARNAAEGKRGVRACAKRFTGETRRSGGTDRGQTLRGAEKRERAFFQ